MRQQLTCEWANPFSANVRLGLRIFFRRNLARFEGLPRVDKQQNVQKPDFSGVKVAGRSLEPGQAVCERATHFDQYFARVRSVAVRVLGSQERDGGPLVFGRL